MHCKRNIFNRALVWFTRFRHRKGYGVQSPSVFHFIKYVIFEQSPYYEYERLRIVYESIKKQPHKGILPRKRYELIFRISNEIKATEIIEIGTQTALGIMYASVARKTASCHIINKEAINLENPRKVLTKEISQSTLANEGIEKRLPVKNSKTLDHAVRLILVNSELFTDSEVHLILHSLLKTACLNDCILLSGIHRSKEIRKLWTTCVTDPATSLSYDLYEAGILFFKPHYPQKCYLINY